MTHSHNLEMKESQSDWQSAYLSIWRNIRPPPKLTCSQWADEYGIVVNGPERGKWVTRPPQKAILDAFSDPRIEFIYLKKSARIGYTSIIGHAIGYGIHQDPCPQLVVQPRDSDGDKWSKEDLQPLLDGTPVLRALVPQARSRDSKTTIKVKHYPGGPLRIVGANSPADLRRISVKRAYCDEVNGYPATAGNEGDQIGLVITRTDDYYERKIALGSTPTDEGVCRITKEIKDSSQGYYIVPCLECGGEHTRKFRQEEKPIRLRGEVLPVSYLKWPEGKPEEAKWFCPSCECLIGHDKHAEQMRLGYWKGEDWDYRDDQFNFLDTFSGKIGFNIWAAFGYSPNSTPGGMAAQFVSCKDDLEKLKTFVNTVLGEEWKEPGVRLDDEYLMEKVEDYPAELPDGVVFLTAFADIQEDRIEVGVDGWNESEESWQIDYQVFFGNIQHQRVWDELAASFRQKYKFSNGKELNIGAMGVDSGYLPSTVYEFVKKFGYTHCYATKGGSDGEGVPIIEDRQKRLLRLRKRNKGSYAPEIIGVHEAKTTVFRRLRLDKVSPGYCHFGLHNDLEYFRQLSAERLQTTYLKGRAQRKYIKIRPRNEALDIKVGNLAVLRLSSPNWDKWKEAATTGVSMSTTKPRRKRGMIKNGRR